jgi:hypothetical protein
MKLPSLFYFLGLSTTFEHRRAFLKKRLKEEEERRSHQRRVFLFAVLALQLQERYHFKYRDYLSQEGRHRRDRHLPRIALLDPCDSPWSRVYSSGNDQAMITVTGFDNRAFRDLLKLFTPYFRNYTPWTGNKDGSTFEEISRKPSKRTGRPRLVSAASCLGLALAWYRFKGAEFILQGWFGFTGTHANVWLKFTRRMLLKAMLTLPEARVAMPSAEKVKELIAAVADRHESLTNVYCVADGLKLFLNLVQALASSPCTTMDGSTTTTSATCLCLGSMGGS